MPHEKSPHTPEPSDTVQLQWVQWKPLTVQNSCALPGSRKQSEEEICQKRPRGALSKTASRCGDSNERKEHLQSPDWRVVPPVPPLPSAHAGTLGIRPELSPFLINFLKNDN